MHLLDLELLPSIRRAALAVAADLKAEQGLDATSDPIVVRLDDSGASSSVDEFDETLVNDRAHEIVIHGFIAESLPPAPRRVTRWHRTRDLAAIQRGHWLDSRCPARGEKRRHYTDGDEQDRARTVRNRVQRRNLIEHRSQATPSEVGEWNADRRSENHQKERFAQDHPKNRPPIGA